uniref:Uncharacterized protein n=1 Tax=viral metagenome TaxID=1070528 RepID=A0A6C0B2X1_9ZZZZ
MNRSFDYNGVQIAPSRPVQKLVKRTRILHIDSADRDIQMYPNNGNYTVYLPRAYERVTGINIKSAEFPQISDGTSTLVRLWEGPDIQPSYTPTALSTVPKYFFLEAKGLNMSDETANAADRSASTNSVFGKFVVYNPTDAVVVYNESSDAHQEIQFFPPLTKLDRFHFRLRTHDMNGNQYMFWPTSGSNWSISLDIETLENSFDEFSTIETRLGERS